MWPPEERSHPPEEKVERPTRSDRKTYEQKREGEPVGTGIQDGGGGVGKMGPMDGPAESRAFVRRNKPRVAL